MVTNEQKVGHPERLVVITGAGRGIGLATTKQLLSEGYQVHAVDILSGDSRLAELTGPNKSVEGEKVVDLGYPLASVSSLHDLQRDFPDSLYVSQCDVRNADELGIAVKAVEETIGQSTGAAIACAGIVSGTTNSSTQLDPSLERLTVEINLFGVMNLARVTLDSIRRTSADIQWGRFIAISSVAGTKALPQMSAYVASKHGVEGFVHTLALDLRGTSATANAIAPGSTRGVILDQSATLYGLQSAEDFANQHLTERLVEPHEIAAAASFLLSDHAASITGSTLAVDGGLHLT